MAEVSESLESDVHDTCTGQTKEVHLSNNSWLFACTQVLTWAMGSRAMATDRWDNWHLLAAVCGNTARSPPAPWAMPTPRPELLAWDARAAPRQGSGRKHRIIRVEFNFSGQRIAAEVLLSGCEEGNNGELECFLERWRDKSVQGKQGGRKLRHVFSHYMPGVAQLSAADTGLVSLLYINQQAKFSSLELPNTHTQTAPILKYIPV